MDIERQLPANGSFNEALDKLKRIYPENWKTILRHYWIASISLTSPIWRPYGFCVSTPLYRSLSQHSRLRRAYVATNLV